MRKSTINLIVGILIGMIISGVYQIRYQLILKPLQIFPLPTTISTPASTEVQNPFDQQIAPKSCKL